MGKGFHNCRFKKTEKAIIEAFLVDKNIPTPRVLARRARISRATLFRHYKTIYDIIPSYERRIYKKYARMISKILDKNTLRDIYLKVLIFIVVNKGDFRVILARGDSRIFEKMVWRLECKICKECCLSKKSRQVFDIYVKEITGVLEDWSKRNFDRGEIELTLGKIMYLTESVSARLVPMLRKN